MFQALDVFTIGRVFIATPHAATGEVALAGSVVAAPAKDFGPSHDRGLFARESQRKAAGTRRRHPERREDVHRPSPSPPAALRNPSTIGMTQ